MRKWFVPGVLSLLAALSPATLSVAANSVATILPGTVTQPEFPVPGATSVLLGRDLFYDPILSGNRNISCATCHNPATGTTGSAFLSLGEGGIGPGTERIARNTPALYNLGATAFTALMRDGRVEADAAQRFRIRLPGDLYLERPVPSVLAAQTLISLVSADEMAAHPGGNTIAGAVAAGRIMGLNGAWQQIAQRVEQVPEYRRRFAGLIGEDEPVHITDIARVLGDFMTFEFRSTGSPFDAFLHGDDTALNDDQTHGMTLFYGKAGCAACHSGPFQTDQRFYAIGLSRIGPGKGHGPQGPGGLGRGAVTGKPEDLYTFRTPSLRNVVLTAPYGHDGAFADLTGMIRQHLGPESALAGSDPGQTGLSEAEIAALVAFLGALSDPIATTGRLGAPDRVPSGLPVGVPPAPPS